jgi:hypothetical protein
MLRILYWELLRSARVMVRDPRKMHVELRWVANTARGVLEYLRTPRASALLVAGVSAGLT